MTKQIENILKRGLLIKLFLSAGRLRVMRTEPDDPSPDAYYAEAPDLIDVFFMFNKDCIKHTTYDEKFKVEGHIYNHYLTGAPFMNKFDQGLSYGTWYFTYENDKFKLSHSNLTFECEADSLKELINKAQEITRNPDFKYEDYARNKTASSN